MKSGAPEASGTPDSVFATSTAPKRGVAHLLRSSNGACRYLHRSRRCHRSCGALRATEERNPRPDQPERGGQPEGGTAAPPGRSPGGARGAVHRPVPPAPPLIPSVRERWRGASPRALSRQPVRSFGPPRESRWRRRGAPTGRC
jgi:hypothetical protein